MELCRSFLGPKIDQRMIAYEMFAVLVDKWPVLMMNLKQKIDEQLMLQMDWVSMNFDVVRQKILTAQDEEEAREIQITMVEKFEQDKANASFFQQAKYLFATKIKGEQSEKYEDPYFSLGQVAKQQFKQRVQMHLLTGVGGNSN